MGIDQETGHETRQLLDQELAKRGESLIDHYRHFQTEAGTDWVEREEGEVLISSSMLEESLWGP